MADQTGGFLHGLRFNEYLEGIIPYKLKQSFVIGLVGTAASGPTNVATLLTSPVEAFETFGPQDGIHTIPDALAAIFAQQKGGLIVCVRVPVVETAAITKTNIIGTVSEQGYTGLQALLNSRQTTSLTNSLSASEGVVPKIICIPGWDHDIDVISAMIPVCESLRAICIATGPNSTRAEALAFRQLINSDRCFLVDNNPFTWDLGLSLHKMYPVSAFIAGLIARNDFQRGWHTSPSNQSILGISRLSRQRPFSIEDPTSEANLLNEKQVGTIIQLEGFRLWGAWTCGPDPRMRFLHWRRIGDMIDEAILASAYHHIAENITPASVANIHEELEAFLRGLRDLEAKAILGYEIWSDPKKNTKANLKEGIYHVDYKVTFPPIFTQINYNRHVVDDYFGTVVLDLAVLRG